MLLKQIALEVAEKRQREIIKSNLVNIIHCVFFIGLFLGFSIIAYIIKFNIGILDWKIWLIPIIICFLLIHLIIKKTNKILTKMGL